MQIPRFLNLALTLKFVGIFLDRSTNDVVFKDNALEDFLKCKGKFAVYVPHTAGRYQAKPFRFVWTIAFLLG